MKKTAVIILFIVSGKAMMAQTYIQGGLNLANITTTNNGGSEKNNILPTFNVGLMARFGIADYFGLESGVLLTGRGSKAETYFNNGNDYVKTKFNPVYVEVPLNAVVKIPLSAKKSTLYFSAGPYIAIGVAGKSKTDSKIGPLTATSSNDIKFSNDDPFTSQQDDAAYDKLKRFDFGVNVGGGFQFQHLLLKLNYGYGLAKINSTQSNNTTNDKNKYRTASISVGIPIGR
jgi:hypothetical protein